MKLVNSMNNSARSRPIRPITFGQEKTNKQKEIIHSAKFAVTQNYPQPFYTVQFTERPGGDNSAGLPDNQKNYIDLIMKLQPKSGVAVDLELIRVYPDGSIHPNMYAGGVQQFFDFNISRAVIHHVGNHVLSGEPIDYSNDGFGSLVSQG